MRPRAKPACMTVPAEDTEILKSILLGSDDAKKVDARQQVAKITILWQHWSPRLKSAVRSDVSRLVPDGADPSAAVLAGYSISVAAAALRDIGRKVV